MFRTISIMLLTVILGAQIPVSAEDMSGKEIFESTAASLKDSTALPAGRLILAVARSFIGTPYASGLLEKSPESLRICLDRTDCILFVEACVAMTVTLKSGDGSYDSFCDNVRRLRYRNGKISGYGSRIHYTSEWLYQAERLGILEEYTCRLGTPVRQEFSYMSSHPERYPMMSGDSKTEIATSEKILSSRSPYYIASNEVLRKSETAIEDGDIVAFPSGVRGLDIAHVGIACRTADGELHFIHASSLLKKVVLETKTLKDFAVRGVRLARLTL